jgi:hypothetical protein
MANSTTKFHAFSREDTTYTSGDLSIGVSVLVPKSAEKGQTLPVLVRWHGGALINGGRMYEPWFPKWYVLTPQSQYSLHRIVYIMRATITFHGSLERQGSIHRDTHFFHFSLDALMISKRPVPCYSVHVDPYCNRRSVKIEEMRLTATDLALSLTGLSI